MAHRNILPTYIELYKTGELHERKVKLKEKLSPCSLCPHECGVDRLGNGSDYRKRENNLGRCESGAFPIVSSWAPHFGEEPELVGNRGSGTIFFTHCNLSCVYCQNYDISQLGMGNTYSYQELAKMMLQLQGQGCHNINFVTPTHMVYQIVKALEIAVPKGLSIPLVYNSGGYDSVDTLKILEGIFDIYMPDFKYGDDKVAFQYSFAEHYTGYAGEAVKEMFRQVGNLHVNSDGIAYRGLMVRHLVLPENSADSFVVLDVLEEISHSMYVNILGQYYPAYHAKRFPELSTRPRLEEIDEVLHSARSRFTWKR